MLTARSCAAHRYVTDAMDKVEFKQPVFVGDVLNFHGRVVKKGRTSVRVHISVSAERYLDPGQTVPGHRSRARARRGRRESQADSLTSQLK